MTALTATDRSITPGRALVVVADSPEREIRSAWAPHLSGPWQALSIDGDHLAMMREPYAGQIATAITTALTGELPAGST